VNLNKIGDILNFSRGQIPLMLVLIFYYLVSKITFAQELYPVFTIQDARDIEAPQTLSIG
jgi:hypothetical protein